MLTNGTCCFFMQNHSSIHIQGISKTNHTKAMIKSCQLQKNRKCCVATTVSSNYHTQWDREILWNQGKRKRETGEKVKDKEGERTWESMTRPLRLVWSAPGEQYTLILYLSLTRRNTHTECITYFHTIISAPCIKIHILCTFLEKVEEIWLGLSVLTHRNKCLQM